MKRVPLPIEPSESPREDEYEEISQQVSKDELHDQIASRGLEILDRGVPYVVRAARWRRIDAARRQARERPLDANQADLGQIMGPFEAAVENEHRRLLVDAMAELSDADVLAVWQHVQGTPDDHIAAAISALGHNITSAGVRKRRERALEKLRHLFGKNKR